MGDPEGKDGMNVETKVPGLDEDKEKLLTVTPEGDPVEERITSCAAARKLYKKLYDEWLPTAKRRARLKGQADGNPPFDPQRMTDLGLGYCTNVNFLETRAILDQKAGAFYELLFEVPTLVEIKQRLRLDPNNPSLDYGAIVAEEFTKLLHDWPGFLLNLMKARREADVTGIGFALWRDEWDWRPKAFNASSLLVESNAELDVDSFEYFFVRDRMTAGEIYRAALQSEASSVKAGWDPKEARRILIEVYDKETQQSAPGNAFQSTTWEEVQQRIRNNTSWAQTAEFEPIKILHLLVREVKSEKTSHYILTEEEIVKDDTPEGGQPATTKEKEERFLFRSQERFEKNSQALWLFLANDGDGYLKSVRGVASMVEPHADLSNRYLGRVFDAGFVTSSLILQPANAGDASRLQLIRAGMITVIPSGVQVLQTSFQPQLSPLIQLRELSSNLMRNNTGVYQATPGSYAENQPNKTARQVAYEEGREARLEKAGVAFDYTQMERLYREMFRRVTNKQYVQSSTKYPGQSDARKFVGRCILRGVPEELLFTPDVFELYVTRAIGMGSWGVKMDLTQQIVMMRGAMDEIGGRNALRDWIAVRVGYANVDRYCGSVDRNKVPSNDTSIASLENNDFAEGSSVPAASEQAHIAHLLVHIAPVMQIVQAFQQSRGNGMDVEKTMVLLSQVLPHIEQHALFLSTDPARQDVVKQVMGVLKAGTDTYGELSRIVMKTQDQMAMQQRQAVQGQEEQQQQLLDAQSQVEMMKRDREYALAAQKLQSLNDMREQKAKDQGEIKREQVAANIQLAAQRQQAELAMKAQVVNAEVALKEQKAGA